MSLLILFNPRAGALLPIVLDGKAYYIEGEATQPTVLVEAFFYDPDDEVYRPNLIETATATLVRNGTIDIQTIEFDRRFGNSDGAVYLNFSHPPISNNLSVRIQATLRGLSTGGAVQRAVLNRTIVVQQDSEDPIPLAIQTDTGPDVNDELRSKKRLDEHL